MKTNPLNFVSLFFLRMAVALVLAQALAMPYSNANAQYMALPSFIKSGMSSVWNLVDSLYNSNQYFITAAQIGDEEQMQYYLSLGANIDFVDVTGNSALDYAIKKNHSGAVTFLIHKGATLLRRVVVPEGTSRRLYPHALVLALQESQDATIVQQLQEGTPSSLLLEPTFMYHHYSDDPLSLAMKAHDDELVENIIQRLKPQQLAGIWHGSDSMMGYRTWLKSPLVVALQEAPQYFIKLLETIDVDSLMINDMGLLLVLEAMKTQPNFVAPLLDKIPADSLKTFIDAKTPFKEHSGPLPLAAITMQKAKLHGYTYTILNKMPPQDFLEEDSQLLPLLLTSALTWQPRILDELATMIGPSIFTRTDKNGQNALMATLKNLRSPSEYADMAFNVQKYLSHLTPEQLGQKDSKGQNLLHLSLSQKLPLAGELLQKMLTVDILSFDNDVNSALTLALKYHPTQVLPILEKIPPSDWRFFITKRNKKGESPFTLALSQAANEAHVGKFLKFLTPEDLGATNKLGENALMLALRHKSPHALTILRQMPLTFLIQKNSAGKNIISYAENASQEIYDEIWQRIMQDIDLTDMSPEKIQSHFLAVTAVADSKIYIYRFMNERFMALLRPTPSLAHIDFISAFALQNRIRLSDELKKIMQMFKEKHIVYPQLLGHLRTGGAEVRTAGTTTTTHVPCLVCAHKTSPLFSTALDKTLCPDCLSGYSDILRAGGLAPIEPLCPPGQFPTQEDFERLRLSAEDTFQVQKALMVKRLSALKLFKFCPTADCFNGKVLRPGSETALNCILCEESKCLLCNLDHIGNGEADCKKYGASEEMVKQMMRDPSSSVHPCPYCYIPFSKDDKCSTVTCEEEHGGCGRTWDWVQGKHSDIHRFFVDHEPRTYRVPGDVRSNGEVYTEYTENVIDD